MGGMPTSIDYRRARLLLLGAGFGVLLLTAGIMFARRVETPEVLATLFFIGIFVAFMFWRIKGGILAAVIAAIAYVLVRQPAIDAVGIGHFSGLIASRSFAFLAFGILGGWANQQLEGSLNKLELYDQIDDETGLYNARFFIQDSDLEMSRAQRYQTIFSVSSIEIPDAALLTMTKRQKSNTLRELARLIQAALRTVDHAAYGMSGGVHRLAIILPETGKEGAHIFTSRLVQKIAEYLTSKGATLTADQIKNEEITLPEEKALLDELVVTFRAIDRMQHPEPTEAKAVTAAPPPAQGPPPATSA
jgi:GGDEF domain-containing protein